MQNVRVVAAERMNASSRPCANSLSSLGCTAIQEVIVRLNVVWITSAQIKFHVPRSQAGSLLLL